MTAAELREKIKLLVPQVYSNKQKAEKAAVEYDELTKFPELKAVIIDLLTSDFDSFLSSIDWVAPRPTTFRINLKNNQDFYLILRVVSQLGKSSYPQENIDQTYCCQNPNISVNRCCWISTF